MNKIGSIVSIDNKVLASDGAGNFLWVNTPRALVPTPEQLEEHPALKQAWEEYMVIRKLLGL